MEDDFVTGTPFEEFMARFGPQKKEPSADKKLALGFNENNNSLTGFDQKANKGFADSLVGFDKNSNSGITDSLLGNDTNATAKKGLGLDKDKMNKVANKGLEVIQTGIEKAGDAKGLLDLGSGRAFDTSADSAGVGTDFAAITSGAQKGASIGSVLGPKGALVGAAVGGVVGFAGKRKAAKELEQNQIRHNLAENKRKSAQLEQEFMQEEGLAQIKNLKSLRQQQLGLIQDTL